MVAMCLGGSPGCRDDSDIERIDKLEGEMRVVGKLENGKKHGQWLTFDRRGRLRAIHTYRKGALHGLTREWEEYPEGFFAEEYYRHGVRHGRYRVFYDEERIAELGWVRRGKATGTWCSWLPGGRLEKVVEYVDDWAAGEDMLPGWPCPLTQGDGRRHLDPGNTDYE